MSKKVRAWYADGVLTPLEPLELEEGEMVELDVAVRVEKTWMVLSGKSGQFWNISASFLTVIQRSTSCSLMLRTT